MHPAPRLLSSRWPSDGHWMTERSFSEGLSVIRAAEAPCPLGARATWNSAIHKACRSPRKLTGRRRSAARAEALERSGAAPWPPPYVASLFLQSQDAGAQLTVQVTPPESEFHWSV